MVKRVSITLGDRRKMGIVTLPFFFLLIVAAVFVAIEPGADAPSTGVEQLESVPSMRAEGDFATLTIEFGEGNGARRFTGDVFEGMTIRDAFTVVNLEGNLSIVFDDRGFVQEIGGLAGPWSVFHNGVEVKQPLVDVPIESGDTLAVTRQTP